MPRPVPKPRFPALFAPIQFTPISRLALRATSRNRTLSITCCDGATFIAFTMLPSGTMVLATSTARSAATELLASAAEHDLAVAAANADGAAAGARTNLFLEIAGVQGDLHVDHADQLHALIEYRDVGGPNLLALNV